MTGINRKAAAVLAVGVIGAGALLSGCAGASMASSGVVTVQNAEDHVITVTSREQVKVEPDMAEIVYSVYSQASDAQTCQTQNGTDLSGVLELLKAQGVAETSIQTSNYGMSPIYDWDSGKDITGYEMTTQITVSDIPIDQAGQLISDSVDAGINSIESVSYFCSSYDTAYQEALKKAVDAAKVKAQALAEAGGFTVGSVVKITESSNNQEVRYNGYVSGAAGANRAEAAMDMGVMPGQVDVEADISVDFSIK